MILLRFSMLPCIQLAASIMLFLSFFSDKISFGRTANVELRGDRYIHIAGKLPDSIKQKTGPHTVSIHLYLYMV
jgi:hypothetical protein